MKSNVNNRDHEIALILTGLSLVFYSYYIITMDWLNGGGDTYSHFLISKNAFAHPELFFHHWGKPFYTLVTAPVAQLGIKAMEFFNLLCMAGSAFIAFKISESLGYKNSWLTVVFTFFAPIVFGNIFSALTEPLSALLVMISVFGMIHNKEKLGLLAFSALLLVRNEALVFFPLILLYLWFFGNLKNIWVVIVNPTLFSIAGSFHYGDLFWLITKFPYTGGPNVYGSGALTHFIDSYDSIVHMVIGWALVMGLIGYFLRVKDLIQLDKHAGKEWLIMAMGIGYLVAHSVVWWLGTGGSAGLLRVILTVIPLYAIIGNRGVNLLFSKLPSRVALGLSFIVACIAIYIPIERFRPPVGEDTMVEMIREMKAEHEIDTDQRIAFFNPAVAFHLDLDPYLDKNFNLMEIGTFPVTLLESGDYLIWDSHFGLGEGWLPLEDPKMEPFEKLGEYERPPQKLILFRRI